MEMVLPTPREGFLSKLEQMTLDALESQIHEWSAERKRLVEWEDAYLLENPTAEKLAEHKERLNKLGVYGQVFLFTTSRPDFPRPDLAEQAQAIQFILRDSYRLFHGPHVSKEEADRILTELFPDEPTA